MQSALGPACQELLDVLLARDLACFQGPDAMMGAANFLINGGMAGALRRASQRLTNILVIGKFPEDKPFGTDDEDIARKLLQKIKTPKGSDR